jgi:hypothetical protein
LPNDFIYGIIEIISMKEQNIYNIRNVIINGMASLGFVRIYNNNTTKYNINLEKIEIMK